METTYEGSLSVVYSLNPQMVTEVKDVSQLTEELVGEVHE